MDSDLIPIWYKAISLDDNPILKERIELLGNITVLYRSYKEDSPYCTTDGVADYIVEFDSKHPNLNQASRMTGKGQLTNKNPSLRFC